MGHHVLQGNPPIEITFRRSPRAKRLSLRVSGIDGRVTLTAPHGVSEREMRRFARDREAWIRGHVARTGEVTAVEIGTILPVEGRPVRIAAADLRRPRLDGETLLVPEGRPPGPVVRGWLKTLARDRFAEACDRHAAALGVGFGRITLRDTRSRWGSCSTDGNLMFSWRLVMAPRDVLDYVAAHEVAHLREMNHSPAFWDLVERLCPGQRQVRDWLKAEGGALHRHRFGD